MEALDSEAIPTEDKTSLNLTFCPEKLEVIVFFRRTIEGLPNDLAFNDSIEIEALIKIISPETNRHFVNKTPL